MWKLSVPLLIVDCAVSKIIGVTGFFDHFFSKYANFTDVIKLGNRRKLIIFFCIFPGLLLPGISEEDIQGDSLDREPGALTQWLFRRFEDGTLYLHYGYTSVPVSVFLPSVVWMSARLEQFYPWRYSFQLPLSMIWAISGRLCMTYTQPVVSVPSASFAGDNLPLTVSGDADLLEQALINLIENALRYSNGRNITLSVTQEGANAILTVKDDGIGIAPEHHDRLFERFYRVDKSRSRELGGTGLGLVIVKHIALIHNGKAEIISNTDDGAEFRIILPL